MNLPGFYVNTSGWTIYKLVPVKFAKVCTETKFIQGIPTANHKSSMDLVIS